MNTSIDNHNLDERSLLLLKALVERYVQDGQPVGSRVLSKDSQLNLSPATIRNVMADLEDMGLIRSPHTSAGRVPTVSGYRLFVDSLLTVQSVDKALLNKVNNEFNASMEKDEAVEKASKILSEVTRMAGVVTLPNREIVQFRHIEFLKLSNNRILVIFVADEQEVHNKIIHTDRTFSAAELQQAANYLNSIYAGQSLADVREAIVKDLEHNQHQVNQAMIDAVTMAQHMFENTPHEDYVVSGQTNLMDFSELSNMERLKQLFEAFNQKQSVLHLLDKCQHAEGVQIFIGEESDYEPFQECSLVTAPYSAEGQVLGVLGVIGPTRMAYEKVIPFVDVTAKLLGAALKNR